MTTRARPLRGANFAYPWSDRHNYFWPVTVRVLVGLSAVTVLLLVLLPFYLKALGQKEQQRLTVLTQTTIGMRPQLEQATPAIALSAGIDSIRTDLRARISLYDQVARTDYPVERLLLHLAEILPDGMVLSLIDMRPAATSGPIGRPSLSGQTETVPAEIAALHQLRLEGVARNAERLTALMQVLEHSPLIYRPEQSINIVPGSTDLTFVIRARLPGTGERLSGDGS